MKIIKWLNALKAKYRPPGRGTVILLAVCFGLALMSVLSLAGFSWVTGCVESQTAAAKWANGSDERYAQVSVFISDSAALSLDGIMQLRQEITSKLRENSIEPEGEEARPWIDAYSVSRQLAVSRGNNTFDTMATGVGGDFFFFHGYQLIHGQTISEGDLLKDVVVIDNELAWRLYGAYDVVGFDITVGGRPCYVGGVVRREESWPEDELYGDKPRIFLSYHMMEQIAPGIGATCYEIVLPDPVTGFALGIVTDNLKVAESGRELMENTGRFSLSSLIKKLSKFTTSAMQTKAIAFPYWENAARAAENLATLFLALALIFALFPTLCALILIVKLWRKRGRLKVAITEYYQRRQLERWQKKQKLDEAAKEEAVAK